MSKIVNPAVMAGIVEPDVNPLVAYGKPTARVLKDSMSSRGNRLTTWEVKAHRFIWAEVLTHRLLSRSAGSSRAIPIITLGDAILDDLALPVYYGSHQRGMQAGEELFAPVKHPITGELLRVDEAWRAAAESGVAWARAFAEAGYHKQLANRHQENYGYIRAVISTTEVDNFFGLRCHADAQPEVRALAWAMSEARAESFPTLMMAGEWHMPYIEAEDLEMIKSLISPMAAKSLGMREAVSRIARIISAARCARTSYKTFDGNRSTIEKDIDLCNKLLTSKPEHASPFEHIATPDRMVGNHWEHPEDHRNYRGWRQLRAFLERGSLSTEQCSMLLAA